MKDIETYTMTNTQNNYHIVCAHTRSCTLRHNYITKMQKFINYERQFRNLVYVSDRLLSQLSKLSCENKMQINFTNSTYGASPDEH